VIPSGRFRSSHRDILILTLQSQYHVMFPGRCLRAKSCVKSVNRRHCPIMFKQTDKFSDVSFKENARSRFRKISTTPIVVDVKISRDACREFRSDSARGRETARNLAAGYRRIPEETFYTVVATFDPVLAHL